MIINQKPISQPVPDQLLISPNSDKELIDPIVLAVPFRYSYWADVSYWSLENGASLISLMARDQSLRGKERDTQFANLLISSRVHKNLVNGMWI